MLDVTEAPRSQLVQQLNEAALSREALEAKYGQVWDTPQLVQDFDVSGFLAPFVGVRRKSDGQSGVLLFQHSPRYYFSFEAT